MTETKSKTTDPINANVNANWNELITIIAALRAPDGCPWDREQTHRSLAKYAIEETYELVDAIESGDDKSLLDELGDVLLQVVLHAQIASETARFSADDVVRTISEKMIRRHPHVFGSGSENSAESTSEKLTSSDVLDRWQVIKAEEKKNLTIGGLPTAGDVPSAAPSAFSFEIPKALPALSRASKIGEKTKRLRFDWPHWQGVLAKVDEELLEVKSALKDSPSPVYVATEDVGHGISRDPVACEIGDLLFSVAQLARHRGLDAEQCLRDANERFERRFGILRSLAETRAKADGRNWDSRSQDELEELWQDAKKEELKL